MTTESADQDSQHAVPRAAGGMARHMLIISSGSVISQAIGVLTTPLISRLFSPDAFGVATVFSSLVGIVAILASLRYDRSITLPRSDRQAAQLLGLCIGLNLLVTLLCLVVLLALPVSAWERLNAPELADHPWLFAIALFLASVTIPLVTWGQRLSQFARTSLGRVVAGLTTTAASLAFGSMGYVSGTALSAARTWGGQLAQPAMLLATAGRAELGFVWQSLQWSEVKAMAKRYAEFPLYSLPASALDVVGRESPSLLFAYIYGSEAAGLLAMSSRLMRIPVDLIAGATGEVLFARASAARAAGEPLTELIAVSSRRLIAAAVWPMLAMGGVAPIVFGDLFGAAWTDAGLYTLVLTPSVMSMFISSPMTLLLTVMEAHRLNLYSQIVLSVFYILPTLLGSYLGFDAVTTLALFSVTVMAANTWRLLHLWRLAEVSIVAQLRHLLLHVVFVLPTLAAIWASHWLGLSAKLTLVLLPLLALPYVWLAVRVDPGLGDILQGLLNRLRGVLARVGQRAP